MARRFQAALLRFRERRAFNMQKRAEFYADMGKFLGAGTSPYETLGKMQVVAASSKQMPLAGIFGRIMKRLEVGVEKTSAKDQKKKMVSIASALAPEIPGHEAVMLRGAAQSGTASLVNAFVEAGKLLDRQVKAGKKLRGALMSTAVRGLVVVIAVAIVMLVVVPILEASVVPAAKARMGFALVYFAFGNAFLWISPVLAVLFLAIAIVAWRSLPRWHRRRPYWRRDWFDKHLLPWSFYVRMQTTFFLSSLAPMLRSGIKMDEALRGMLEYASPWLASHIRVMLHGLTAGRANAQVLAASFFPRDTSNRLAVYTLLPDFTEVMTRLADDNFEIYEAKIDRLASIAKTVSVLVLALFVLATLGMIYDFATATQAAANAAKL